MNLFKMFDEAKRRCSNRLRDFTCARIPLPWAAALVDEIMPHYGPTVPLRHRGEPRDHRGVLRYCHDQGVTHRRVTVEDLFPREVRAMAKV